MISVAPNPAERGKDPAHFCHFCGLPVPKAWWKAAQSDSDAVHYCCYGCRLAESVTGKTGEQGQVNATLVRLGLALFFSMNVMVFSLALWSQDLVPTSDQEEMAPVLWSLFRYICLLFSLPVFFLLAGPLAENAVQDLRDGHLTTDLLLVIGVAAAFIYSAIAVFTENGHVYFDVGCTILVMVTLGRWLEAQGKVQTTEAIESLSRLLPETALVLVDGRERTSPLDDVAAGAIVRVLPGETIPFDGVLRGSSAAINEQILTGESVPRLKHVGDPLYAGTVSVDAELELEVTAANSQGTIARLIQAVHEATRTKGRYQKLADKIAVFFIPAVIVLALATFGFHGIHSGFEAGLKAGLAVLLIACPCALGLATPMAVWAALGQLARRQTVCRSGETLEKLAEIECLRFDKTGTLTTGWMEFSAVHVGDSLDRDAALTLAGSLAERSNHPASAAIARLFRRTFPQTVNDSTPDDDLTQVVNRPGLGLTALSQSGLRLSLGSLRFVQSEGADWDGNRLRSAYESAADSAGALVCLAVDDRIVGVFPLQEQIREQAKATLEELKRFGLDVAVLTGDHARRAAAVSQLLEAPVHGEMLPDQKVEQLRQDRRRYGPVAMVGDGINDAPALAAADVGIAMACGADVSRHTADVCLLSDDLSRIPWMLTVARQTVRVIRQNLFWAFAYNILAVGFAVTGRLNPVLAAAAMVISSAIVVVNSLRLRGKNA